MDIIANRTEITAAITIDEQRFVAPAEHMAEKLVPMVQPNRIGAQEPGHAGHQVGIGGFDDQMKMVAHQAKGMHLEAGFLTGFRQGLEIILPVYIIQADVLPPVAPAHDVVNSPTIFNSHLARHGSKDTRIPSFGAIKNEPNYGLINIKG